MIPTKLSAMGKSIAIPSTSCSACRKCVTDRYSTRLISTKASVNVKKPNNMVVEVGTGSGGNVLDIVVSCDQSRYDDTESKCLICPK